MLEGVQLGTIEGYAIPADFFTGAEPRFGEFSIPLLFKSTEQANKVLHDPEFNKYVLGHGRVERPGWRQPDGRCRVVLFRPQEATASSIRLQWPEAARQRDADAERMRMAALGATAVPMGLQEMITSLQNGVIDGTMSGISIFTNFNLQNLGTDALGNP